MVRIASTVHQAGLVAQGLGAAWGFIAGWLELVFYGISIPFVLVLMSTALQELLLRRLGLQLEQT